MRDLDPDVLTGWNVVDFDLFVLDGIHLLRGAFVRMDDYGLDTVARAVLGEGKTLAGRGRAEEILRLFEEDRERLVEYNRTDARLALEVLERLRLVELAVERSRLAGLPSIDVVLDFKSLYPSLIRTFEIDPLNLIRPEAGQVARLRSDGSEPDRETRVHRTRRRGDEEGLPLST